MDQNRYQEIVNWFRESGQNHAQMGRDILERLWEVQVSGLYLAGNYESLRDFVEEELAQWFDGTGRYLRALAQVVARVFVFVERCKYDDPIVMPNGEILEPEFFLKEDGWLGKLIRLSQLFPRMVDEVKRAALVALLRNAAIEDIEGAINPRPALKLHLLFAANADGTYTVTIPGLKEDELNALRKVLDKYIVSES